MSNLFKRRLYGHCCKFRLTFITRDGFDCSVRSKKVNPKGREKGKTCTSARCYTPPSSQQVSWREYDVYTWGKSEDTKSYEVTHQGSVVRKMDSVIHRIVILQLSQKDKKKSNGIRDTELAKDKK